MRGRRLENTGGVTYYTLPPQAGQDALLPENTLKICFGPRTMQMPADRLPQ
jgi:hypothetical protein